MKRITELSDIAYAKLTYNALHTWQAGLSGMLRVVIDSNVSHETVLSQANIFLNELLSEPKNLR